MNQRDMRPPFAALGGTIPPELEKLPTPCYLLDEDAETVVQITDQISDENGTPDPRRALQLPADVIAAGLTPNPRK